MAFHLYCEIRILRVKLMKTEFVIGSNLNKMKVAIKSFLFSASIYILLRFLCSFILESLKLMKNQHDQGNKFLREGILAGGNFAELAELNLVDAEKKNVVESDVRYGQNKLKLKQTKK